jgi:hypothetical protein
MAGTGKHTRPVLWSVSPKWDVMPVAINIVLICGLVGLLVKANRGPPIHRRRRVVGGLLLGLVGIPVGIWQAALYLSAKQHLFARMDDAPFVRFLREHLPYTVSQVAVEILFVGLICLIAWLLGNGCPASEPPGHQRPRGHDLQP